MSIEDVNAMETKAMENTKLRKLIVSVAIGAVAGFIVSFGLMRTIQLGVFGDLDLSRSIAALAGSMYILCGAFVGFGILNPKWGAKFLNVEDPDELREQSAMLRNSTFGIIAFGLVLVLLAFAAPLGPVPQGVAVAAIILLLGASTFTSLRSLKVMDELNASLARETAVAAFYITLSAGGGWAMFAHLGFVPALASLDWLTLFAAAMLAGAFWASGRRGLLLPR